MTLPLGLSSIAGNFLSGISWRFTFRGRPDSEKPDGWRDQTLDLECCIQYSITHIAYAPFASNTLDVCKCFCVTGGVCRPSHTRHPPAAVCDSPPARHPRPALRP